MRPSTAALLSAWLLQSVAIPIAIWSSRYAACNDESCRGRPALLFAGFPQVIYYGAGAASVVLLLLHLHWLETDRWKLISFLCNGILACGSCAVFLLLYMTFAHWHP